MKAYGFATEFSQDKQNYVEEFEQDRLNASGHDIVVEVKAVGINPVDTKVRVNGAVDPENPRILGYDASGIVVGVGENVTRFHVGDEVFYAGAIARSGSFAHYQIVDERIVGHKPKSLSYSDAAALPLTSITAWELLFERFGVKKNDKGTLLIIGGAGGVGSILTQLAKTLTNLTVIATASRQDTVDWCQKMGADHVINHHEDMAAHLKELGIEAVDYAAGLTRTDLHFKTMIDLLKPAGKIGVIDDPGPIDVSAMKLKSLSFHWEFMFTKSMFETHDMVTQSELLNEVSQLVDQGKIITTANKHFGQMNAQSLNKALIYQASGSAVGKSVLDV